jgi:hypothetical protein
MTVFESYSKLWKYFKENDSFTMDENFRDIIMITDQPSRDRASVQSALDDWVKSEILTVQKDYSWEESPPKDIYILKKSLDSNEQSISIHPNLAGFMMDEINGFCELIEDKTDWCDARNVSSKDVMNLLHILHFYKGKYREAIGEEDEK